MLHRCLMMLLLATIVLACEATPAAQPPADPDTPLPAATVLAPEQVSTPRPRTPATPPSPRPTFPPMPPRPTPLTLSDLDVVELGTHYRPTGLSGGRSVGTGTRGTVYLADVETGEAKQLVDIGDGKRHPVISGNMIAWTDKSRGIEIYDNNNPSTRTGLADDIWVLDIETGEQRRITEEPAKRSGLRVSGHRLVWMDNRNEMREHYTHYDIFAYDLETDEEIEVAVAPGSQMSPAIYGDIVVWADNRDSPTMGTTKAGCGNCPENRFDIYMYNFETGQELVLDDTGGHNSQPDVHGRLVVWVGYDGQGDHAIYVHDIDTGEKSIVDTPDMGRVYRTLVSEHHVVWTVGWPCDVVMYPPPEQDTGVFAYDLRTAEVRQLSNYVEPSITLDGSVLVISEACFAPSRVYAVSLD